MNSEQVYADVMSEGTLSNPQSWMLSMARQMAQLANHRFQKLHSEAPKTILDIGCGVGEFTRNLSEEFECTGIDKSRVFVEKAKKRNEKGKYICADFMTTEIVEEFGIVSATHEVFNIMKDFRPFLNKASQHLSPEGFLIFDLITPRGFETWQDIQIQERSDFVMIQKCLYDSEQKRGTVKLTGFVGNGESYGRFDVITDVFNHDIEDVCDYAKSLDLKIEMFPEWGDIVEAGIENPKDSRIDNTTKVYCVLTKC